jgi:hypothetical protein
VASINFLADFQEVISQELSTLGYPPEPEELFDSVLMRYLNFQRRIPPVIIWTVRQSKELSAKSFSKSVNLGLKRFIEKAESGQSLKPHLSTQSDNPDYRDLMFYDWGVFHFHLGTNPHSKRTGFVERTDDLLFAIADLSKAEMYLIDIHPHRGGFTNQDLLRIIENNWPEILEPYTLQGVIGLTYNASDNDINSLRKSGLNTILQTPNGRFLTSMGGGITAAGTSIRNRREADRVIISIRQLETWFIQQKAFVEDYFKSKHDKDWADLTFKVKSFELPLKVEEIKTGEVLEIPTGSLGGKGLRACRR